MSAEAYQFVVGNAYSRQDVFRVIDIEDPGGGNWYTGYTSHLGDWFIFCGVNTPGRTGHDYPNHFSDGGLVWFGKTQATIRHPSIQALASALLVVLAEAREEQACVDDRRQPWASDGAVPLA